MTASIFGIIIKQIYVTYSLEPKSESLTSHINKHVEKSAVLVHS